MYVREFSILIFVECCFEWIEVYSHLCNSFLTLIIHSALLNELSIYIFDSKIFFPPLHLVVGMSSPILTLSADRIFIRSFWICCYFRRYLLIYLFELYLLFLLCCFPSLSEHILMFFFCLSIFDYCRRFLICLYNLISHLGCKFLFFFYWGPWFFTDYFHSSIDKII